MNQGTESTPLAQEPPSQSVPAGSVGIPKMELPKQSNAAMDMIGLIVYQGRIYTQTSSKISPEAAKAVLGEKIGRTKGNIDEWSSQKEFDIELASSIGEQDVYMVKGYNRSFRIMTYQVTDGQVWSEFFECLNGITISSGADLFQKLKIMGNVQSVNWESFDSWNGSKNEVKPIAINPAVQAFLQELYNSKPIEYKNLSKELYDKGDRNKTTKFLDLKLKDQSEIQIALHHGGYVRYSNALVFFKLDEKVFNALWDNLK